ncbi:hypothetical protein [Pseudostreptobacillus hongkongensis]|uniref:hypothetical protein n=1 Tax=Pseudostreptobacillus hongkongensis TaxID=1162717 RepID=UPI0012E3BD7E|nr:hypothetical protein [Pseudostreptobacillus hongkongensis]
MKKVLLGVLALTSVGSFANVSGYLKSESEVKATDTVTTDNNKLKLEGAKFPLKTKLDLGFFLDEKKDSFVFTGVQLSGEGQDKFKGAKAYAGVRLNTKVSEHETLTLNAVASNRDKDYKAVENAVKEHLSANGLWTAEKRKELEQDYKLEDREKFYKENGYVYGENDRLFLSALLNGNYETGKYTLGTFYNLDAEGNSRLDSIAKAEKELGKVKLEANLEHLLGHQKGFTIAENGRNLLKESDAAGNLKYAGRLKGDVKLSTDKLVDGLYMHTKPHFDLGTVLEITEGQDKGVSSTRALKAGLENEVKYTGIKNIEIKGQLNYDAEVLNKPATTEKTEVTSDNIKQTGNAGEMLHLPNAKLDVKYNDGKLLASTENKDTLFVGQYFGDPVDTTDNSKVLPAILSNEFETKNTVEYKFTNNFKGNAVANYKLVNDFYLTGDKQITDYYNTLLTGFGLGYENSMVKSELNARYSLSANNTFVEAETKYVPEFEHEVLANTRNEAKTMLNKDVTLTGTLNAFNKMYVDSAKDYTGFFGAKAGVKAEYAKDQWMASAELNGKYGLLYEAAKDTDTDLSHMAAAQLKTGLGYSIDANHKVGFELDNVYSYGLSNTMFDRAEEGINRLMKDNFKTSVEKSVDDYIFAKAKDMLGEIKRLEDSNLHILDVMPKVNAEFKYGKVTVKPEVSAKFGFGLKSDTNSFRLTNIEGKGKLNVEYMW